MDFAEKLAQALSLPIGLYGEAPNQSKSIKRGTELWVFPNLESTISSNEALLRERLSILTSISPPEDITIIRYVLNNSLPNSDERFRLIFGQEAVTARMAIYKLLDLPEVFGQTQEAVLREALFPIAELENKSIPMQAWENDEGMPVDALELLEGVIIKRENDKSSSLYFVEAEAGKGKTILLATLAAKLSNSLLDRLIIYVPLRRLPLEVGISIESIAQLIGATGTSAQQLVKAVRCGLVILLLDGIDEVAGRYDRKLIGSLLNLLTRQFSGNNSIVILSGRKTEARHIYDDSNWNTIHLALPSVESNDFRKYVELVVDSLLANWDSHLDILPDQFLDIFGEKILDQQARNERDSIVDWIVGVFPAVGKEQSLFFVQGLSAIGIGCRINNRRPLTAAGGKIDYVPKAVEVCRAAAVFACMREQKKIESLAQEHYSTEKQLRTLRGFAILSSATQRQNLPTPNEIARQVFQIDAVNQNELYTAIARQNAKHALLYASEVAAGNFVPKFLNEWMRNAFLAAAAYWSEEACGFEQGSLINLVATADRARLGYSTLLPELFEEEEFPTPLLSALKEQALAGSEAASANLWQLRAALGHDRLANDLPQPCPLSQIDQAHFFGGQIGDELSGEEFFLDDSEFDGVRLTNVKLSGVSMIGVIFRQCVLDNVSFKQECEGPIIFEGCIIKSCVFENMRARKTPALQFFDCQFEGNNNIFQDSPVYGPDIYQPLVEFRNCITDKPLQQIMQGSWHGLGDINSVEGIGMVTEEINSPEIECLREMLRTFFPRRMGNKIQARDYIRLSALGRGRMPAGSPSKNELQTILESVGFGTGGRSDHLYAPWSGVMGGGEAERQIRSEMNQFMKDHHSQGTVTSTLITKLKRHFN